MTFTYDHQGRRVRKQAERYNGTSWDTVGDRRFLWSGWLCLVESGQREVSPGATPVVLETFERDYTWGRDLSGSLQGAGGIGGLLAMADDHATPATTGDDLTYVCFYDANGNVGQLVDLAPTTWSAGVLTAKYEYSPFGKLLASTGDYADENPFRFSTKYLDVETGLSYFGYRYYSAQLGRWINRDPIGIFGGLNVLAYVSNTPCSAFDALGLKDCCDECDCGDVICRFTIDIDSVYPGAIGDIERGTELTLLNVIGAAGTAGSASTAAFVTRNCRKALSSLGQDLAGRLLPDLTGAIQNAMVDLVHELQNRRFPAFIWAKVEKKECKRKSCGFFSFKRHCAWGQFKLQGKNNTHNGYHQAAKFLRREEITGDDITKAVARLAEKYKCGERWTVGEDGE